MDWQVLIHNQIKSNEVAGVHVINHSIVDLKSERKS